MTPGHDQSPGNNQDQAPGQDTRARLQELLDARIEAENVQREADLLTLKENASDPAAGFYLDDPDPYRRRDAGGTQDELAQLGLDPLTTIHGRNRFTPVPGFIPHSPISPKRLPGIYDHHLRCTARFLQDDDVETALFHISRRTMRASAFVWFANGDDGYEDAPISVDAAKTNSIAVRYRHLSEHLASITISDTLVSLSEGAKALHMDPRTFRRFLDKLNSETPGDPPIPIMQTGARLPRVSRIDLARYLSSLHQAEGERSEQAPIESKSESDTPSEPGGRFTPPPPPSTTTTRSK